MSEQPNICASCHHLAVDRDNRGWPKKGAVGYCRLRDFHIESIEDSWCANHPERNYLGFEARIGPIWVGDLPVVLGGFPVEEEGSGEICTFCKVPTPGPATTKTYNWPGTWRQCPR